MRIDLRELLAFALASGGAALLAVAALDWFAYDFAFLDLLNYEGRVHRRSWLHFPYSLDYADATATRAGRAAIASGSFAVFAAACAWALARTRRLAPLCLVASATSLASLVAIAVHETAEWRHEAWSVPSIDPDTGIRWLAHHELSWLDTQRTMAAQEVALWLTALAIAGLALAGTRLATRRGCSPARARLVAAALALPPGLAALVLAWLSTTYVPPRGDDHETWVALVQHTRVALLVTALLVTVAAARRRPGPAVPLLSRLVAAAALAAAGLAALGATTSHRRAIDVLYPATDAGAARYTPVWLRRPWNLDVPSTATCIDSDLFTPLLIYRHPDGEARLEIWGQSARLADEAELAPLLVAQRIVPGDGHPHELELVVERRIPAAAVVALLARIPRDRIAHVTVTGMFTRDAEAADGPLRGWHICPIGQLDHVALLDAELPAGATWSAILDDPTFVRSPERR